MIVFKNQAIHRRTAQTLRQAVLLVFILASLLGCSVFATRPVQEMSDTAAAMRAAREVGADSNASHYYRAANELFFKARQEYRLKNFARARKLANQARMSAEKAEFLSIKGGAIRSSLSVPQQPSIEPKETAPPPPVAPN